MIGNNKQNGQMSFLFQTLKDQLNPRHPLYQLSNSINWKLIEDDFSGYYIDFGRPVKPILLMVSLLILNQLDNLSDESVVSKWVENSDYQYCSGEAQFQWSMPCDLSDLVHSRNRIGRLVRELKRKLPENSAWFTDLNLYLKVMSRTQKSKNKVYSIHEPEVSCISKGKDHRKFEFGSKISFATTKTTSVIVSVVAFIGNPYDGNTLKDTLDFHKKITGKRATQATVDRG